jgi:hypothetical protein
VQTLLDGVTVGGHRQTDELIATNQIKAWQFLFAAVEEGSFEVSAAFTCQLQAKVAQQEALTWGPYTSSLSCFLARNKAFFGFGMMVGIILLYYHYKFF